MRCPVCGGLPDHWVDGDFFCDNAHTWRWTEQGLVMNPRETEDVSTWEGEGGR